MNHYELPCSHIDSEPSAIDILNNRINSMSNRVNEITPYIESKKAYIDDTFAEFSKGKNGFISCSVISDSGEQIPCELIVSDTIIVRFEPLKEVATVTISIA